MALIACPECKNQVSTMAAACPKCGAPLSVESRSDATSLGTQVTTTQQTSKTLKGRMVVAVVLMIGSILGMLSLKGDTKSGGLSAAFLLIFLGSGIFYFYIRFKVWWHHR